MARELPSDDEAGLHTAQHRFLFTEMTRRERAKEFFSTYLRGEAGTFLATAISLWALAEIIAAAADGQAPIERLAIPALALALVVALYRAFEKQRKHIPEVLAAESGEAQQIYRRRACGWNAALAREMIASRIGASEATLERLGRGSEYVTPVRLGDDAYFEWMQTRPEAILRICRAAAVLCTQEVPHAVSRTGGADDLLHLRNEVDALANMYASARDLEVECYKFTPPDRFEAVHETMFGWTDPIRRGVEQFCDVLDEIAKIDRNALKSGTATPPSFGIAIEAPERLEEFSRRLEALRVD